MANSLSGSASKGFPVSLLILSGGVCRIVKPKFITLSEEHQNVIFIYADAENFPRSRELANIENLPTFAGFAHGKLIKQAMGSKEEAIKEIINEITSH